MRKKKMEKKGRNVKARTKMKGKKMERKMAGQ